MKQTAFVLALILIFIALSAADKPYIGVYLENLSADQLKDLGIGNGVRVVSVVPDSPAENAGLAEGMVVLSIDRKAIKTEEQMKEIIDRHKPGDKVKMAVLIDETKKNLTVKLGNRSEVISYNPEFFLNWSKWLEMKVQELTPQLHGYFNVKNGLLVTEVDVNGTADRAGVKAGDVIVAADGKKIHSGKDLRNILRRKTKGDAIRLELSRSGKKLEVVVGVIPQTIDFGYYFGYDSANNVLMYGPDSENVKLIDLSPLQEWIDETIPDSIDFEEKDLREEIRKMKEEIRELKEKLQDS